MKMIRSKEQTASPAPTWRIVQRAIYLLGLCVSIGAFSYGVPLLKCFFILLASVGVALALAAIENAISSRPAALVVMWLVVAVFVLATSGAVWTWFRPCDLPVFANALGLTPSCGNHATVSCSDIPDLSERLARASLPGSDPKVSLRLRVEACHLDVRFSVPAATTALRLYEHIMQTFDLTNHLRVEKPKIVVNDTLIATYEDWILLADGHLVSDGVAHRDGDPQLSAIPIQDGALLTFKLTFHAAIQATNRNKSLREAMAWGGPPIHDIAL